MRRIVILLDTYEIHIYTRSLSFDSCLQILAAMSDAESITSSYPLSNSLIKDTGPNPKSA